MKKMMAVDNVDVEAEDELNTLEQKCRTIAGIATDFCIPQDRRKIERSHTLISLLGDDANYDDFEDGYHDLSDGPHHSERVASSV